MKLILDDLSQQMNVAIRAPILNKLLCDMRMF
jgi:hypothetical protein